MLRKNPSRSIQSDFTSAAFWAGLTTFLFISFGALTLELSLVQQFHLTDSQAESWITITWVTAIVASLSLALYYRQPLSIAWSIPGLIFMASLANRFSYEEFAGASLIAGVVILLLDLTGAGQRLMAYLPLPILMGMFAATILAFITRMVEATANDFAVVGPMAGAYLLGRVLNPQRLPPIGMAVLVGAAMVLVLGRASEPSLQFSPPSLVVPTPTFSWEAILSVSLPLVILVLSLGNAPSEGFLAAQGYTVPSRTTLRASGLASVVNAIFGGHTAGLPTIVVALSGGRDAGQLEKRYWAVIVAFLPAVAIAIGASLILSVVEALPSSFIAAVAGLAILSAFQDALSKAFGTTLTFGAAIAFCVALSTVDFAGLPPAMWGLVAGLTASLVTESEQLRQYWQPPTDATNSEPTRES